MGKAGVGIVGFFLAALALVVASGCSLEPPHYQEAGSRGHPKVVAIAERMVGAPYRYGGNTPKGFDCSGLVYYSYRGAGYHVPRTTEGQFEQSGYVEPDALAPGDILFFRIEGKPSHVGIYAGRGRFIHAPSSGKHVQYSSLNNIYWRERLVKVGRF